MHIDLSGRKAFVSGSSQGIGRAIAAGLARSGAAVTINGRDEERVQAAVEALRGECPGAAIDGIAVDVANAEGAERLFEKLPDVDILVNNLGIFGPTPVLEVDDATWQRYVTKTALLGVSRGYAKAVAGTGVTVNAVIAGPTHTEGVEDFVREMVGEDKEWDEAQREFVAEHRPNSLLGRLIEPEEIANLVVYLSSDHASATTGGAIRVDGGYVDHILP